MHERNAVSRFPLVELFVAVVDVVVLAGSVDVVVLVLVAADVAPGEDE
ncbi:MAG TPA: hypothetical protein VIK54_10820 [Acidimicrobiia bacterium]